MATSRNKQWYSDELNKMFNLKEEQAINFTKLTTEDLISFFFCLKVRDEATGKSDGRFADSKGPMSMLDGPIAKKIMNEIGDKDIETIRKKFPIASRVLEKVMD
ncbi:MAG: hypothetical protein U9R75_11325 [Candidatus Thermoplasmatota archaeon]|nr:hypothetical protein [Candidatus Thermoplasmatota archaeon]